MAAAQQGACASTFRNARDDQADRPAPPTPPSSSLPADAINFAQQFFQHARDGNTEAMRPYLDAGLPSNLTNDKGDSLLMLAASRPRKSGLATVARSLQQTSTVQLLLEKGADPNRINDRGQSIIAGAVFKGHLPVVKLLHDAGADLHAGQPTAVQTATMFQRRDLLESWGEQPSTAVPSGTMPNPGAPSQAPRPPADGPER